MMMMWVTIKRQWIMDRLELNSPHKVMFNVIITDPEIFFYSFMDQIVCHMHMPKNEYDWFQNLNANRRWLLQERSRHAIKAIVSKIIQIIQLNPFFTSSVSVNLRNRNELNQYRHGK